jgi:predicted transcriptional regulator of viral defense system
MSTFKRNVITKHNITARRFALLAAKDEKIFHIKDLAALWQIQNANTLRITLGRYQKDGLIYRIFKGFYSLVPPDELSPPELGAKALHSFCYLSTETVLYDEGFVSQKPSSYTFVSPKSKKFKLVDASYKSRQLKSKYLYNPAGICLKDGINIASPERAIADMLYFNPKAHFDKNPSWDKVKEMQKSLGYPLTKSRYVASSSI